MRSDDFLWLGQKSPGAFSWDGASAIESDRDVYGIEEERNKIAYMALMETIVSTIIVMVLSIS